MSPPLFSLVLAEDNTFQVVIWAVFIGIWILSAIIQAARKASAKTRRKFQEMGKGHQPLPHEPKRAAARRRPPPPPRRQHTVPRPAQAAPEGDLMGDLETILRDQLGLPVESKRPAQAPAARPAAPSPPARPQAAPARPPRPARPTRPPTPTPRPRVREYIDPVPRARAATPAPAVPALPQVPETAREAYHTHDHDVYAIRREHQRAERSGLRQALRGKSLKQAIVLAEILGPPRSRRGLV